MRLLMVEIFGRGGITHYSFNLVRALSRLDTRIALYTSQDYELRERLEREPLARIELLPRLYRFSNRLSRRFGLKGRAHAILKALDIVLALPGFAAHCLARRPDVVHIQGSNPIVLLFLLAAKLARRPTVYTAHDAVPLSHQALSGLLDRWIYALSDRIIVHSAADRLTLAERYPDSVGKLTIIQHGHYRFFQAASLSRQQARQALGIANGGYLLLCFGFLSPYKGLEFALRALPSVRRELAHVRLLAVGDPIKLGETELDAYHRLARQLDVSDIFELQARYVSMEEVPLLFKAVDCALLPYTQVSQSGVLHLAWAMGVPVIASSVGAFPETISEGRNGLLVPPGDADALARAIIRLGDPQLAQQMGREALKAAESGYSWRESAKDTLRIYRQLCSESG